MENPRETGSINLMRWVSFTAVTAIFAFASLKAVNDGRETDKIVAGVFLVVVGFVWGANIWKFIVNRVIK